MPTKPTTPIASMTPAKRRRHRVREAILDTAESLFADEGEAGLSMRRIAERMDYSPAALYQYFGSKEELIHAIREQFFERLLQRLRNVRTSITEGPTLCRRSLHAYIDTGLEQPGHYLLAFAARKDAEHQLAENSNATNAAEELRGMIVDSVRDGWFRDTDLALAASAAWATAHGLTMLALTMPEYPQQHPGREGLSMGSVVDFQADLLMRGLATPKLLEQLEAGKIF